MNERLIHIVCILLTVGGLLFIAFLYASGPRSLAEIATKGQVAIGVYSVDRTEFQRAIALFRADDFTGARAAFERADPEKRDAETQFYVGYSFYRQGWGRFSNDDALFTSGFEAAKRSNSLDPNFRSTDENLQMRTATELQTELEEGLKITPADFNPLKLARERK